MPGWEKWLWGGLGWAMGGPIGGILGFVIGSMSESGQRPASGSQGRFNRTSPGDFGVSMMVLLAAVMRADDKLLKSELDYVKQFFNATFGPQYTRERMLLFKDLLKQDFNLQDVARQIRSNMDHAARLQLLHLLFGLAQADGELARSELNIISEISGYLGITIDEYESIRAMFVKDADSAFKILEIEPDTDLETAKKAYRRMANKYHPDKVSHLGPEFTSVAEEKFKAINEAYQQIKTQKGV